MLKKNIFYFLILLIIVNSCLPKYIEEINNICKKVDTKHKSIYKTSNEFFKNINYDPDYKNKNEQKLQETYDLFIGNKLEEDEEFTIFLIIKDYLLNRYIIPIIIIWIIFCYLFIKKLWIFKPFFYIRIISRPCLNIIMIMLFILLVILSIGVYLKITELNFSINGTFCNLLKFFYELNRGKIKEKEIDVNIFINNSLSNKNINDGDLWPGLYDLNSILLDSSDAINKISLNENKTFYFLEELNDNINEYQNLIKSIMETASKKINNPNYFLDFDILTKYSYEFNNISRANSYINIINSEFIQYFHNATELIKSLNNYCISLSNKSDFYDNELNDFFDNISDFSSLMKEISMNITNNIIIYEENYNIIIFIIKILNIISSCFSIFILFLLIFSFHKKYMWIRISLHIVWNIGFVLIINYFCFLYFLNNLENIFYDSLYIMDKEILNTNKSIFFDKCLNTEESDLKEVLNIYDKNSVLIDIDRYYKNIYPILNNLEYLEQEIPKLDNIKKISNNFNNYLNNYELSTNSSYENSDVNFVLNEITKITNKSNNLKREDDFFCDSNDIWVSSKQKCKDYIYISRYDLNKKFERKKDDKYCFMIQDDYQPSDLKNIYKNICTKKAYNQLIKYIIGLTRFYNNNENLLNSLEKILKEIERYNKKLSGIIIDQISKCEKDISDLIDIYNPILGNINITYLFKCGGLKRKIINFYDINYNQVLYNCNLIKKILGVIVLVILFGNISVIIHNKEVKGAKEVGRRYLKFANKDLNEDGVELIEEVPGEDDDT